MDPDAALRRLIRSARLLADMAAYQRTPPTTDEVELASVGVAGLVDDTDWAALYADELP